MGLPWMTRAGPTRMSRIEMDKRVLPYLPVPTEKRAGNLIERLCRSYNCLIRTT
jgi:hypothetical protein